MVILLCNCLTVQVHSKIQQDVHKPKKPWKSHSKSKNFTSKVAATLLVKDSVSSVFSSRVHQATNTAPFPRQYQVPSAYQSAPWWTWGPYPHPGIKTGTCGRRDHSTSYSQDHQPVVMIHLPSSLAVTLQHQHKALFKALQILGSTAEIDTNFVTNTIRLIRCRAR